MQHVACVWSLGCDLLQHVATCWVRFLAQIWKWSNFSCNICGCCMMLESFGQVRATMLHLGMRTSSISNFQHVATRRNWGWPNACNMLRPAMLRSVTFKCCDRLAGVCKCWANNVRICCVEVLLSFGRGLKITHIKLAFYLTVCLCKSFSHLSLRSTWSQSGTVSHISHFP